MTEPTLLAYEDLLATTSITDRTPTDALNITGTLVNHSHDRQDDNGARHAITLAAELPISTWPPRLRAYAYYDLANAYDTLRKHEHQQPNDAWTWGPTFDEAILYLRQSSSTTPRAIPPQGFRLTAHRLKTPRAKTTPPQTPKSRA